MTINQFYEVIRVRDIPLLWGFMKNIRHITAMLSLVIAIQSPINATEAQNNAASSRPAKSPHFVITSAKGLCTCGKSVICAIHKLIGYIEDHPVVVCAAGVSLYILYINIVIETYRIYLGRI